METMAIVLNEPGRVSLKPLRLHDVHEDDVLVKVDHSGISTGTERLLWNGTMPPFPGMGYPLVPGYEAVGHVIEAGRSAALRIGQAVFVPGATCFEGARGLFGASASHLVTPAARALPIGDSVGEQGILLALAATARHVFAGHEPPDLIVGHGVLGRLLARLVVANGDPSPTVWETNPARRQGASGYSVVDPEQDHRRDYRVIADVSGDAALLNSLIGRLHAGGEIILAGFYSGPLSFAFPPAFMREARIRVAAQWQRDDLEAVRRLVETGALSLDDLITHRDDAASAASAYATAFEDSACLKMVLDWRAFS